MMNLRDFLRDLPDRELDEPCSAVLMVPVTFLASGKMDLRVLCLTPVPLGTAGASDVLSRAARALDETGDETYTVETLGPKH